VIIIIQAKTKVVMKYGCYEKYAIRYVLQVSLNSCVVRFQQVISLVCRNHCFLC